MAESSDLLSHPFTTTLIEIKARQLCRRSDFSRSDYDDLRQDMFVYLLQKERFYDPARGNVEAFVTALLTAWVRMELRSRSRQKRSPGLSAASLERVCITAEGECRPLRSHIGTDDLRRRTCCQSRCPREDVDVLEAERCALDRLTEEERELLEFAAAHGAAATAREWSHRLGRPVSRRWVRHALDAMQPHFRKAGFECEEAQQPPRRHR